MGRPLTVKALLIEDDPEDADIFRRHASRLNTYSLDLAHVTTEREAEEKASQKPYDIIFLDLNLNSPLSGLDFIKRMRAAGMKTPMVVVTGSGDETKAVEAMKSGAYDYLVKDSLSPDLIGRTIRSVLQRVALERERDEMLARLEKLSVTDPLTGLANRRILMERLEEEVGRSNRNGRPFAVLMVDLDHFKDVNDLHGHKKGDSVLKACADALLRSMRSIDIVARYGGEEFCAIMPDTDIEGALAAAERIRRRIEELPDPVPTASVGVAVWHPGATAESLLSAADKALYEAKHAGRNCVRTVKWN